MTNSAPPVTLVLPARNESDSLATLLPRLVEMYPDYEIVVVDDGSSDNTRSVCAQFDIKLVQHPYSKGNGAAIKSGARAARGKTLVFLDADGQHDPADISRLVDRLAEGYDMVVGARSRSGHASTGRWLANTVYNTIATWMANHRIPDLTSGMRAVDAVKFREFLYLLPNGFSYPTTITMAFFRVGYAVAYEYIQTADRAGKSHISPLRDGVRFMVIIFKVGTLYSPLKIFLPASVGFFATGLFYYAYTYISHERFTNMSALLFIVSVLVFLVGLVSEQITTLMYRKD